MRLENDYTWYEDSLISRFKFGGLQDVIPKIGRGNIIIPIIWHIQLKRNKTFLDLNNVNLSGVIFHSDTLILWRNCQQ